jgi:hypothetical protein
MKQWDAVPAASTTSASTARWHSMVWSPVDSKQVGEIMPTKLTVNTSVVYWTLQRYFTIVEEQQRLVREYGEGTKEEKAILEKRYGRQQLQRLVDNALSEAWVSGNSQKCPHCNVSIEVI